MKQLPERLQRLEDEATVATATFVPAMVTVYAPVVGRNDPTPVSITFPALIRTCMIYKGRPAFLAADPEEASS